MQIKIVIREEIFIHGLPGDLEDVFMRENTFDNPKLAMLERLGKWTGNTPRNIFLWRKKDTWLALPRGYFPIVIARLQAAGVSYDLKVACPAPPHMERVTPTGTLFDYQEKALDSLLRFPTGTMESPVGSGKTQIMLSAISRLQVPTLILVHTTELLRQTAERCNEWLGYKAGIYGAGKKDVRDITVGMVQTLIRDKVDKGHPLYTRFGCVIQDECLSPATVISTPAGPCELGDLSIGDSVCTPFGTEARIVRVWDVVKPASEYLFSDGTLIVASADHKIWSRKATYTDNGHSFVDSLIPIGQSTSGIKCTQEAIPSPPINLEEYLIGWAYADGYCDPMGKQIKFSFRKKEKIQLFRDVFGHVCRESTNKRGDGIFTVPQPYGEQLRQRYSLHPGKKAPLISIHPSLVDSHSIGVVRGLFDADGCRARNSIVMSLTSKQCLEQIQLIMAYYGVDSTLKSIARNKAHHSPKWLLGIWGDNINRYNAIFGWGIGSKNRGQFSKGWKRSATQRVDLIGVRNLGEQRLIDIEISHADHLFLANGLIVSNCHHTPSTTFTEVLTRLPYKYKYGFTATPFRKDRNESLIFRVIGPITAKVSHKEVEQAGRILWPEVRMIPTEFYYQVDNASEWTYLISALIADEGRNRLICRCVRDNLDGYGLILTDRIEHANTLAGMLSEYEPVLLTGELTANQRTAAMEKIRAGALLTIATVHVAGEGLSVNNWNMLFLVSPIAGGSRTVQALGRITRPAPGKDRSVLFDFVDTRIPMLAGAARARAKLYRTKGE